MKNSTVEQMIRTQFNIPSDVNVNVECLASTNDCNKITYDFKVSWYINYKYYIVETTLPHLSYTNP